MDGNTRQQQQKQLAILFLVNITVYSEAQKGTSHYWLGLQGRQRPPLGSLTQTWIPCIQCNNCRERSTRTYPLYGKKHHDTSRVWYLRTHHTVETVVLHANMRMAREVGRKYIRYIAPFRVTDLCNEQNKRNFVSLLKFIDFLIKYRINIFDCFMSPFPLFVKQLTWYCMNMYKLICHYCL